MPELPPPEATRASEAGAGSPSEPGAGLALRLLRLYPRAWRERYRDEFLALLGDGPLTFRNAVDVVAGAVDARMLGWWRSSAERTPGAKGGATVLEMLRKADRDVREPTTREALLGAAIVIACSLLGAVTGPAIKDAGFTRFGDFVLQYAFFVGFQASMLATFLKHHSWRIKAVFGLGPLLIIGCLLWFVQAL
jgi:hypothetical protein